MTYFLQFVVIGVGLGCSYALFAQGAVLIYRGSGVVNFGQGALGMVGAYVTYLTCQERAGLPVALSVMIGILASVCTALVFRFAVLDRLRSAAPITRLISTLGLLTLLRAVIDLHYGGGNHNVDPLLPHRVFDWGGVRVQEQALYIVAICVVLTFGAWAALRWTRTGLALTATAENERAVQTLGWSPQRLSTLTWGLGAALAAVAGIALAPLTGLSPVSFTLVVTITSLASALLGGFRSFPLTLVGGLTLGLGEAMSTAYRSDIERALHQDSLPGLTRGGPFVLILIVLVVRGRGLPLRSHIGDRLPFLGSGRTSWPAAALALCVAVAALWLAFDDQWAGATLVSASVGVVLLSVVVLTGLAGQVSLGQFALAGIGAMATATLMSRAGWPLALAMPAGALLTAPVGALFALPALRTRGVNLAIVTLAMGFTIREVVLSNAGRISQGRRRLGAPLSREFLGVDINSVDHPHRYASLCIGVFTLVAVVVANLRRSATGRRLIAVRTNERAAASLGVNVFAVKLYAFAVAAAIAGLGGVLISFRSSIVVYDSFTIFSSINAVSLTVIGGVGFALGAVIAAPLVAGGLLTRALHDLLDVGRYDSLITAGVLLLIIIVDQNGAAAWLCRAARRLAWSGNRPRAESPSVPAEMPIEPVVPRPLVVSNLTVRFGNVVAVNDVSFEIGPGEVVGLIGPNGAGKTTIIDAVSGFVRPATGHIELGGQSLDRWSASRRARAGVQRSFQSLELFEDVSVEDNIRSGAECIERPR
ncbi:MAG: ATP-binding cassette domain-containing protein, partial [Acidimicrobiia bacterium]